jgi:PGF-pre-PGF domain-containing protein
MPMRKNGILKNSKVISIILTIILILAILFSGPASAVNVGFLNVPAEAEKGESVNFQTYVDIETNEIVPFQNFTVVIGNVSCTFDINGNNLTECSGITITPIYNYKSYGYGELFGYGYGYDKTTWGYQNYSFGYGYGYEYGYGYGSPNYSTSEIVFNITWNTSNYSDGNYSLRFYAEASSGDKYYLFSSSEEKITITSPTTTTTTIPATTSTSTTTTTTIPATTSTSTTTTTTIPPTTSTSTTTTTTTISQVGGAGGTPYSPRKMVSYLQKAIGGNTYTFDFSGARDLLISSIDVKFASDSRDVSISVERVDNLPTGATSPVGAIISESGKVYTYFIIRCNVPNENLSQVTIKFKVPKSWIKENNLDPNSIFLGRYTTIWTKLSTSLVSSDNEYYYYEAISTGFSVFAIFGETITQTTIPTTLTTIPTTIPTTTISPQTTVTTTTPTISKTDKMEIIKNTIIILVAIGVILAIILSFIKLYKKPKSS